MDELVLSECIHEDTKTIKEEIYKLCKDMDKLKKNIQKGEYIETLLMFEMVYK